MNFILKKIEHFLVMKLNRLRQDFNLIQTKEGIEALKWTWKSLEDTNFDKVCGLSNDGLKNWEIVKELEIDKSTVSRYVKRGKKRYYKASE